eukprot:CAMPEP_0194263536 /NCGR_PEP_ID=MMETSP0158-20130606/47109_1 /TAXON_ID=33649 /ORGANISM="Thalassionema nitzschioides, Strain L26-B" /LENGTH=277 /DNA_ID=CAMNT_0039003725 /DNA_START=75 /DNA_END=905 /DNA_ORIENTATION=+
MTSSKVLILIILSIYRQAQCSSHLRGGSRNALGLEESLGIFSTSTKQSPTDTENNIIEDEEEDYYYSDVLHESLAGAELVVEFGDFIAPEEESDEESSSNGIDETILDSREISKIKYTMTSSKVLILILLSIYQQAQCSLHLRGGKRNAVGVEESLGMFSTSTNQSLTETEDIIDDEEDYYYYSPALGALHESLVGAELVVEFEDFIAPEEESDEESSSNGIDETILDSRENPPQTPAPATNAPNSEEEISEGGIDSAPLSNFDWGALAHFDWGAFM